METLLKHYYEKYVFQDEDIAIKNVFYDDIDALDKIAIPVELCLKKFGCFILTRFFKFKSYDNRAIVRYVLYDDNVPAYYSNISSILGFKGTHPTKCNGYQSNNNIVVYFKNDCSYMYGELFINDKQDLVAPNNASNFLNNNIIGGIKLSDCEVYEIGNTKLNTSKVINKFKPYIDELNKYLLEPIDLKRKHRLLLGGNRRTSKSLIISKAFNVLEHELTHFFDNKNADKINYYSGVNTTDVSSVDPKIDKNMINKAEDILYRLWSYTEMNAYSVTHGKQGNLVSQANINDIYNPSHYISDIGSVGNWSNSINGVIEYLKNKIKSIASYDNDEFWGIVKNITINGCRTQKVKDRYSDMSNNTFRNYFIKTSYKLLEKFRDKTIKKGTQQALYNKDTMLLAKEIRNAIDINNSKYVYSKNSPFEFKMTFPYYFENKGQTYNITLTMSSDNTDRFMRDRIFYFNDNINITLECKKLNLKYKVKSLLSKLDSFFNLYCELLNKPQRKLYLDRIAIDMASDLRFVLNQVGKGRLLTLLPMACAIQTDGVIGFFKQKMLEKHTLDAVFSFPTEMFYPGASAVACCMVFDLGKPHRDDQETFFGYFREDGFEKRKGVGRVDVNETWETIQKEWFHLYNHRLTVAGKSINRHVNATDEWCAEAYMKADYSKLSKSMFLNTVREYISYLVKDNMNLSFLPTGQNKGVLDWMNDLICNLSEHTIINSSINTSSWMEVEIQKYFNVKAGKYYYSYEYDKGDTPYLSASNENNGVKERINIPPDFDGNCIVTGKVGCTSFYEPFSFCATSDVNILLPKFHLNVEIGLFIATIINFNENFRWNYGRQCRVGNTQRIKILLPSKQGEPDWQYMENYIKSLPYGDRI